MARRRGGFGIPIGEIEKVAASLGKSLGGTAMKAIREVAGSGAGKKAGKAAKMGAKKAPAKKAPPRKAPAKKTPAKTPVAKTPAKKTPATKAPATKQSSVRASKKDKGVSPTGRPIGRIAATPPERPRRDYYSRGATLPKDASSQRAAERSANRYLKGGAESKPSKPRGNSEPVNVQGSFVTPPRKARMQDRSRPSSGSYEADTLRGQRKDDARRIGPGQRKPRKKKS